ncbi:MAG: RHS repeat domain-containing protein [Actinomycetota bacterium]
MILELAAAVYHKDGIGSVTNVTSSTGTPQWSYSYEPFGASRSALKLDPLAPDNPMQFTGEYQDPTGLYHLRARQYDPGLGRFTATDPRTPPITSPMVSPYVYVNNRPTVLVDPSGFCGWTEPWRCVDDAAKGAWSHAIRRAVVCASGSRARTRPTKRTGIAMIQCPAACP